MVELTEEQVELYEQMCLEDARLGTLPIHAADIHTVNGYRVLCIETDMDGERVWVHYPERIATAAEMAAITMLHDCVQFSADRMEGYLL